MKKFAKMSLVAAVAVAGFTSAASAKPLEEAIKNVDVSGSVVYRYNDYQNDNKTPADAKNTTRAQNNYKIGLTLKAKVNDDVTAVTRFVVANPDSGFAGLYTGVNSDQNVDVTLSNVYFSYSGLANTTVNVGKQGLTTPWTVAVDSDGNEQTGTGILALTNVGPVTLAAAYFNQTNLDKSGDLKTVLNGLTGAGGNVGTNDIWTAAIMGNIGPVALDGWYLDMADMFDTFTLGAKANFDLDAVKLGFDVRYTSLDRDNVDTDNELWKIIFTAKMGIFDAKLGYAGTDKEGGIVALDNDAVTAYQTWNMNPNAKADADMFNASLGVQALPSLHISANYSDMDYKDGTDDMNENELYAQFVYKMSKNFGGYIRYGSYDKKNDTTGVKDIDGTRGRLQVEYTF
ncbi:hypothetical protein CRV08_05185 [Halarcobacter ebronensis]|uniref:Campylo_MOMP domain-containing protein n=1 Tax=Halarcobacter ebronensis TaxID=1462615 RepID=A0A4Q0YEG6_9BACT|nr:porin [Halarcobacter ebronensis]RXJ68832.1 hypothetical protein CRV08_05185 [Halarcobacter ebronensis]